MMEDKRKKPYPYSLGGQDKGTQKWQQTINLLFLLLYEISEGITMNKRTNLILLSIILGGAVTFLPVPIKVAILASTVIALFMRYDFYEYDQRNEVGNHE